MQKRTISILGSTGSIGRQSLDVLSKITEHYRVAYLTTNSNIDLLASYIEKFNPLGLVITDENQYWEFKKKYSFNGKILAGRAGLLEAAADPINDIVLSALVGFSGVEPTFAAIEAGTTIALANKETLVSAGKIITEYAKKNAVDILAVDSEHSAVLQCLTGESRSEIEKIILTASGGPFLNKEMHEFKDITIADALNHPNWSMGSKITIDSATMMNKGFEVIEAYWLFDLEINQIEVMIHPQSIVHSLVQFVDGSIKAQLGLPDMRIPISYALSYPRRLNYDFPRLELNKLEELTFFKPDYSRFPCLSLAFDALRDGGSSPAVLNASNEIAVKAFLDNRISFIRIPSLVNKALEYFKRIDNPSLSDIIEIDRNVREFTNNEIENIV